jgi:surface antigen
MQIDQTPHKRQTNPQAAVFAIRGSVLLNKRFEHASQQCRWDADPRIADRDHSFVTFSSDLQPDLPAHFRVFGGIIQQIGDYLHQT